MSETWIIRAHPEGDPEYITIESARFGEEIAVIYNGNMEHAHLIKAAPKMREALEYAKGHLEEALHDKTQHPIGHCPVLDFVRQALAEANGETE